MSYVSIPDEIIYERKYSLADISVYLAVKSFMNTETRECYPAIKTISKTCNLSISTVKRSLSILKDAEFFTVRKRKDTSNIYKFPEDKKGAKLVPSSVFDCLEKKEVGFYAVLLSFRNSTQKHCKVSKKLICERANISKGNKLIVSLMDALEKKGVIQRSRNNREYEFSFPTLTYDSDIEKQKTSMYRMRRIKRRKKVT